MLAVTTKIANKPLNRTRVPRAGLSIGHKIMWNVYLFLIIFIFGFISCKANNFEANFNSLKEGITTKDKVRLLLGEPTRIKPVKGYEHMTNSKHIHSWVERRYDEWRYLDKGTHYFLYFSETNMDSKKSYLILKSTKPSFFELAFLSQIENTS